MKIYQWIKLNHVDDKKKNSNLRITSQVEEGITIRIVIFEEVSFSNGDSFQNLMRELTRTSNDLTIFKGTYLEFQIINTDSSSCGDINR